MENTSIIYWMAACIVWLAMFLTTIFVCSKIKPNVPHWVTAVYLRITLITQTAFIALMCLAFVDKPAFPGGNISETANVVAFMVNTLLPSIAVPLAGYFAITVRDWQKETGDGG